MAVHSISHVTSHPQTHQTSKAPPPPPPPKTQPAHTDSGNAHKVDIKA